jgi:uncharacterized membrane-anchored protein YhcB (DUF1043 family)
MNVIMKRDERLEQLYQECQDKIIQNIIGPFGLSKAMFDDKNGGNITTTHNFKQGIVASESDQLKYDEWQSRQDMKWQDRRNPYDLASDPIRTANKIETAPPLIDGYTGESLEKNKHAHYEHITPVVEIEKDPGRNLRMNLDERVALANSAENTTYTIDKINTKSAGSGMPAKDGKDLIVYFESLTKEQIQELNIKPELIEEQYRKSKKHIATEDLKSRIKKEGKELLTTGVKQAVQMALRQSLGILLVELVNGLFNEFKDLIKHGVQIGKMLIQEINERLRKIVRSVIDKIPDAVSQFFEGGISGFVSNLITFLINIFLTTAKKIVTAIREAVLGLYKAFKMIFFPPKNLSEEEALREGIKILSGVVITSVAIILEEAVFGFMKSIPFGAEIGAILMGIITGLLVSFISYQIDLYFNSKNIDERMFELIAETAASRGEFAHHLANQTNLQIELIKDYAKSIDFYQNIGSNLAEASVWKKATLSSLDEAISQSHDVNADLNLIKSILAK